MKINPVIDCYFRAKDFFGDVINNEKINSTESGWSLFEGDEKLGEVVFAVGIETEIGIVRKEVRRVLVLGENPESVAQEVIGEILLKIDEVLNEEKEKN